MSTISQENYLKRVCLLQWEHKGPVPMGALASAMEVSGASTTGMAKSLVERGYLEYEPYKGVSLTEAGEREALDVIRRHRLLELFLVKTLGLDWADVHEEAERLEHAVSEKLLGKIDEFLGHPQVDPHGDPIPPAEGTIAMGRMHSLADCQAGDEIRITRVIDQDSSFLRYVDRVGLRPGTMTKIVGIDGEAQVITVQCERGDPVTLAITAAEKLLVDAI